MLCYVKFVLFAVFCDDDNINHVTVLLSKLHIEEYKKKLRNFLNS